jgi:hypothetical protein
MATAGRREVLIEVYTDADHIVGTLSTREGRLSDALNYEVPHVLVLSDVTTTPVDEPEAAPARATFIHIDTRAIAFAVPATAEPGLEERRRIRDFDYVEKERHRAVAMAPPFRFEGYLHLPRGDDVERSLWNLTPAFIPLSDARVSLKGRPGLVWSKEVVILNRRRAQIQLPVERQ